MVKIKKKKNNFLSIIKVKIKKFFRFLFSPFRRMIRAYRVGGFFGGGDVGYDAGEIAEDGGEDDTITPTDQDDLDLVEQARYFYDKHTNAYYFSHGGGHEDNYYYDAESTYYREELEEEFGRSARMSVPFYEYYHNFEQECEQFRIGFFNDFRIELPGEFVDEDRSEHSEDPMLIAVPPFILVDHPQHHHEHTGIHTYHDEDNFVMNKWDQEEGEMFIVSHHTRDEYEGHEETPFGINSKIEKLPFDALRKKGASHGPITSKEKVGYNLDLIINYSLRDYYGFLAFDDNINISVHLAKRWGYEDKDYIGLPSDVYAQKQLDLIVDHLLIRGILEPYFYTWAAPTHQEVREFIIHRSSVLGAEARQRFFLKLSNVSKYIKIPVLKFKIGLFKTRKKIINRFYGISHNKKRFIIGGFGRIVRGFVTNIIGYSMHLFHIIWGIIGGTCAVIAIATFLHYCLDENILTIGMVDKPGEQEIGLPGLYLGILLHFNLIFYGAKTLGRDRITNSPFIGSKEDILERENDEIAKAYSIKENERMRNLGGYGKYRRSNTSYGQRSFTKYDDNMFLYYSLTGCLLMTIFDDQMAFHGYLEDGLHIQIAVYDGPILNGDVPI